MTIFMSVVTEMIRDDVTEPIFMSVVHIKRAWERVKKGPDTKKKSLK